MISDSVGALLFGLVIGWVTYRTLRRATSSGIGDIASVIGSVGGATITGLFSKESGVFGSYCLGLALGFFLYLITAMIVAGKTGQSNKVNEWLGERPGNPRGGESSLEHTA
jgi:NhaP-type Na+/H+ or K+/H+ antiporter